MAPSAVEGFFAILAKRTLGRSVFRSVAGPQAAINRFREEHNRQSRPFAWAAGRDKTIAAVRRGRQVLDSIHSLLEQRRPALAPQREQFLKSRAAAGSATRSASKAPRWTAPWPGGKWGDEPV